MDASHENQTSCIMQLTVMCAIQDGKYWSFPLFPSYTNPFEYAACCHGLRLTIEPPNYYSRNTQLPTMAWGSTALVYPLITLMETVVRCQHLHVFFFVSLFRYGTIGHQQYSVFVCRPPRLQIKLPRPQLTVPVVP